MQLFPSRHPLHMVAVDVVEFPRTRGGYKACLTAIDRFTRYAIAIPMKNKLSKTVIAAFRENWINRFGVPENVLSDNGPEFTSNEFVTFADVWQFKHLHTTPYHPQSNGMVERLHRFLKRKLTAHALDKDISYFTGADWTSAMSDIVAMYNNTQNRMTSYSPHQLMFGHAPNFPIDLILNMRRNRIECDGDVSQYMHELAAHQRRLFLNANRVQQKYDSQRKSYYDKNRAEADFKVGEHVTLYQLSHLVGHRRKLTPTWDGIWRIERKIGANAVRVRELVSKKQRTVNVDKLKRIRWTIDQMI